MDVPEEARLDDQTIANILDVAVNEKKSMLASRRDVANAASEKAYKAGMRKGIWLYAYWKGGVQYVSTGQTFKDALKENELERDDEHTN